jgi:hypothetical protein
MTKYEEPFEFDFDTEDDVEHVAEPLRDEANRVRQRERSEHEAIVRRQRDRAWGRAVTEASVFAFASTPHTWCEPVNSWTASEFVEHADWLRRTRDKALAEGLQQQADHAAHLGRLVTGQTDAPYEARRSLARHRSGDSVIASALANGYGEDPRQDFLDAMGRAGIIPSNPPRIGAGNVLHTFHVLGDAPNTANGWAVLHRCPGAGSFGSWRTGVVHHWHSTPELMAECTEQFANDIARAGVARDNRLAA